MSFPSCHSTRGVIRSRRGRNVIYVHVSCLWPWNIPAMCSAFISDITGCVSRVDEEKGFQLIHMRMSGRPGRTGRRSPFRGDTKLLLGSVHTRNLWPSERPHYCCLWYCWRKPQLHSFVFLKHAAQVG